MVSNALALLFRKRDLHKNMQGRLKELVVSHVPLNLTMLFLLVKSLDFVLSLQLNFYFKIINYVMLQQ